MPPLRQVILAPQLIKMKKKDLGLPHVSEATDRQKREGVGARPPCQHERHEYGEPPCKRPSLSHAEDGDGTSKHQACANRRQTHFKRRMPFAPAITVPDFGDSQAQDG
jgi:hypothetical protein